MHITHECVLESVLPMSHTYTLYEVDKLCTGLMKHPNMSQCLSCTNGEESDFADTVDQ